MCFFFFEYTLIQLQQKLKSVDPFLKITYSEPVLPVHIMRLLLVKPLYKMHETNVV